MPPEHCVRCLPSLTSSNGDPVLQMEIDGAPVGVKLCISNLTRQMMANLPDRSIDLLEIAALVYGIDSAVPRGGSAYQQMGAKWHRRFVVEMPVRDLAFWSRDVVRLALEDMLMFLSGDRIVFDFLAEDGAFVEGTRYFSFDRGSAWQASRVLMFSGGLDSFAGALEEIVERREQVALVSHFSASKIAPVQRSLFKALRATHGVDCCCHIPVQVQMTERGLKEGTHRSRSFLFAVLGAITAQAFGQDRVSFHENGVVSLNLPPVGNVLGTRATRTTHPQTLARFTKLLCHVFEGGMRVDNPFFWRTKKEVVETVARLGMKEQIRHTRSCADVHNQTRQYPHCGRCSQCIDRRFAVLAAGLAQADPEEAYCVPLMEGARTGVIDREIALSYLRNAQAFEHISPEDLERHFPAVLDAVTHLQQPPATALQLIRDLLARHGAGVADAMREILRCRAPGDFPESSLPRLYGEVQRQIALPILPSVAPERTEQDVFRVEIDPQKRHVGIGSHISMDRTATADLLIALAEGWLVGAGQGLGAMDFPCASAHDLAKRLGLEGDEAVRRRVLNARKLLKKKFQSAGLEPTQGADLIENVPWHGYRLAPERVTVRRVAMKT